MAAERHVKLFKNGRNQAVRIPREFELPGKDALIRKEGDRLIIEPIPPKSLLAVLATLRTIEEDFPPIPDPRQCSDEDKHRACRCALSLAGIGTKHRNLFQMGIAMRFGHAGMRPQLNVRCFSNLINQVLRHGAGERFATQKNAEE